MTPEAPGEAQAAERVVDRIGATVARHVAQVREAATEREATARQQRMEEVASSMHDELVPSIGPLVEELLAVTPEGHPARPLLESLQSPDNPLLAILLTIVGYIGMILALPGAMASILVQQMKNELWCHNRTVPLSPADLANMVVQGYLGQSVGEEMAGQSGLSADNFDLMVKVVGMPPSPQDLFEMYRRGIIGLDPSSSGIDYTGPAPLNVVDGLKQGHTKDEWIDAFKRLAFVRPSATDFVAAAVREQLDYETAARWAESVGLDFSVDVDNPPFDTQGVNDPSAYPTHTFFDVLFDIAGRPPGPVEAADMAWRSIIPWEGTGPHATTFQQAIAESDVKTKWTNALQAASAWRPTVTEIGMMYAAGVIDDQTAEKFWTWIHVPDGLLPTVKSLYVLEAARTERETAKENVVQLYLQGALSDAQATSELEALGFASAVVEYLLKYAQYQRLQTQTERLLETIGRNYVSGKTTNTDALTALQHFGIPEEEATGLIQEWETAKALSVPTVTAAQIASAVYYSVESPDDGMADLIALGYTPYNAWRLLSLRLHVPIPEKDIPNHPGASTRPPGPQI